MSIPLPELQFKILFQPAAGRFFFHEPHFPAEKSIPAKRRSNSAFLRPECFPLPIR